MSARPFAKNSFVFLSSLLLISTLLSACADSRKSSPIARKNSDPQKSQTGTEEHGQEGRGGLFPLDAAEVPEAVRLSSTSIFEIWVPVAAYPREMDASLGGLTKLKAKIARSASSEKEKTAILNQFKACERKNGWLGWLGVAPSACKYSFEFVRATAFLAGDAQTLWTSFHTLNQGFNFRRSVLAAKAFAGSPSEVPFFLFNANGDLVYDSTETPTSLQYFPEDADRAFFSSLLVPAGDFLALRLGRIIGEPLRIARSEPAASEELFGAGFSDCTGCGVKASLLEQSDRAPKPNADGHSLRFGRGVVTVTQQIAESAAQRHVMSDPSSEDDVTLIFSSVDGNLGHKGGPALNAVGEVVGLTSFVHSYQQLGKLRRSTIFVRPAQLAKLAN